MAAKGRNRTKMLAEKKSAKLAAMNSPGFGSNYSKKAAYLKKHSMMGWEFAEHKPWKSN